MIRIFFAKPGAGKSTMCCALAKQYRKKYDHRYINFDNTVPGCHTCTLEDLGDWTFPPGSYIAIDEAGIQYNSRKTLSLPQKTIAWLKLHRHYKCDLDYFSQSYADVDITIRRLASELWLLYRIGPWTLGRRIYLRVGIDKNTHQIVDEYRFAKMLWLLIWPLQLGYPFEKKFTLTFRPFYYRYFDSWTTDNLAIRHFPIANPLKERKRSPSGAHDAPEESAEFERKKNSYFVALKGFINKSVARIGASALSIYLNIARRFSHEEDPKIDL